MLYHTWCMGCMLACCTIRGAWVLCLHAVPYVVYGLYACMLYHTWCIGCMLACCTIRGVWVVCVHAVPYVVYGLYACMLYHTWCMGSMLACCTIRGVWVVCLHAVPYVVYGFYACMLYHTWCMVLCLHAVPYVVYGLCACMLYHRWCMGCVLACCTIRGVWVNMQPLVTMPPGYHFVWEPLHPNRVGQAREESVQPSIAVQARANHAGQSPCTIPMACSPCLLSSTQQEECKRKRHLDLIKLVCDQRKHPFLTKTST